MAGLADLLGTDNPFQQWVAGNRGKLGQIGAGLGSGQNFSAGLAQAAQNIPYGQQTDDAYAAGLKADAERQESLNQTIEYMRSKGYDDLIAGVQSGGMDMGAAWGEALRRGAPKPQGEAFTLGAGETRYGPDGSVLAQGPEDVSGQFGNEKDLWSQYSNADPVKVYEAVKGGYQRVYQGAQLDSGAGDMSVIYGFMKMNDPGSVVRESEFEMAAKSGSLGEQIQGFVNQIASGQRLDPEVRQRMVEAAAKLYDETSSDLSGINSQFTDRATQYGVNPANVIRQPEAFSPLPGVGAGPPRRTSSGVNWSL